MTQKIKNELPHDLLSEKSLLSCLILDSNAFDEISDLKIVGDDFYHPKYGIIYEAIKDMALGRKPIDYVTLCSHLNDQRKLEDVGGESFILEVTEELVSSANIRHYAQVVKDKSSLRDIVRTARRVAEMGVDFSGNASEFIDEVESSFFKLTNEAKTGKMSKLNDCLKENLKELEDTSRKAGEIQGIPTG